MNPNSPYSEKMIKNRKIVMNYKLGEDERNLELP